MKLRQRRDLGMIFNNRQPGGEYLNELASLSGRVLALRDLATCCKIKENTQEQNLVFQVFHFLVYIAYSLNCRRQ
jgi:hypothetical protein